MPERRRYLRNNKRPAQNAGYQLPTSSCHLRLTAHLPLGRLEARSGRQKPTVPPVPSFVNIRMMKSFPKPFRLACLNLSRADLPEETVLVGNDFSSSSILTDSSRILLPRPSLHPDLNHFLQEPTLNHLRRARFLSRTNLKYNLRTPPFICKFFSEEIHKLDHWVVVWIGCFAAVDIDAGSSGQAAKVGKPILE